MKERKRESRKRMRERKRERERKRQREMREMMKASHTLDVWLLNFSNCAVPLLKPIRLF